MFFKELFATQESLQKRINMGDTSEEVIRNNMLGLIDEAMEVMGEVSWKPWKEPQGINKEQALEEMVDLLQFWVNICLEMGFTPEMIDEQYNHNLEKVRERIRIGY